MSGSQSHLVKRCANSFSHIRFCNPQWYGIPTKNNMVPFPPPGRNPGIEECSHPEKDHQYFIGKSQDSGAW